MLKEDLRRRALAIVTIPPDFKPLIEEYIEGENGEGAALFFWVKEESDEGISIELDLEGNLIKLSVELNHDACELVPLDIAERRERAEQFLLKFYPDALEDLTFYEGKELSHFYRFYYERLVMGLPLRHAGCMINVDSNGVIVGFSYTKLRDLPEIPTTLITKEQLIEYIKNQLNFQLQIVNHYSSGDSVEGRLRVVYEPEPFFMSFRANALEPTLSIIHDDEVSEKTIPLSSPSYKAIEADLTLNEIIGIPDDMEIIREVDMGEETGVVWRDKNWQATVQDLSINGFFKKQTEETVKAFVSKKTGKVRSFSWFKERSGNLELTRKECLQVATDFLQLIIPNSLDYLNLIVQEEEEGTQNKAVFSFRIHNGNGIPVESEIIIVSVNPKTGQIDYYSGPSFELDQLRTTPGEPTVSREEASKIFLDHLDFELSWEKDYEGEEEPYVLVYKACDQHKRIPIRYIDAMNSELIYGGS
ncbi:YcdB/YcdC domain-containing protein [Bacillus suaedae]|uniref:DUF4901 domain-containing protein n=1 Tax=Halalkalibacter suaedae TaxID=2822140 RepID=A0A941ANJ9_9BACI|nr:YcdB/YcdC domain-containing protein [Bacillus suaedae]MBP3950906.1 DUF4901 domain-containing protein [Bacillus suaedae]